jgi:hypothetical protein
MDELIDKKTDKKPTTSSNTVPIRLKKSTLRSLKAILNTCNRKAYGKRVKADDVIAAALELVTENHIESIQRRTYTSQDQLDIEHKKYCSVNGAISKDEFLKLVLQSALQTQASVSG